MREYMPDRLLRPDYSHLGQLLHMSIADAPVIAQLSHAMESQVPRGPLKTWHEFQVYAMRYRAFEGVNKRLTDSCAENPHIWDSYFTGQLQMSQ